MSVISLLEFWEEGTQIVHCLHKCGRIRSNDRSYVSPQTFVLALQLMRSRRCRRPNKQQGRTGRTDEGDHITLMSHDHYSSQVRSTDLVHLEESDVSPMILRSLAGRPFARLPFLCPPHPVVQARTKDVPTWNLGH